MLWAVLFLPLLVLGCSSEKKPEPGRYYNEENRFSIKFPSAWEKQESSPAGIAVLALSPLETPGDPFRENVNVGVESLSRGATVESYFDTGLKTLREFAKEYREIATGKGKVGKENARWVVFVHKMEGLDLEVLSYFLIKRGRGYIITFTALQSTFPQRQAEFETVAQTFRFE